LLSDNAWVDEGLAPIYPLKTFLDISTSQPFAT